MPDFCTENEIDNVGVMAFVEALKINTTVTRINLSGVPIYFCFVNRFNLCVLGNPCDYNALQTLVDALKKNQKLKKFQTTNDD